ncbi:hypothetical protein BJ170DRAFT_427124 [Xylariales sp. AK1849]|nr:hypothetical protein BJ170DRAFT_427124 [Xylariales sp. AK1849]
MPGGWLPSAIASKTRKYSEEPLLLPDMGQGPMVIDYDDIMGLSPIALFEPYNSAELFFDVLAGALTGPNITRAAAWKAQQARSQPAVSQTYLDGGPFSRACVTGLSGLWSNSAILCSDGVGVLDETKDKFKQYMKELQQQSDALGTSWSHFHFMCTGWKARPAWTFEGPIEGVASSPILLIGNSLDPVTPLRKCVHPGASSNPLRGEANRHSAQRASTLFPGSVVLHQNTQGHCSYSNPSIDTAKSVRAISKRDLFPSQIE